MAAALKNPKRFNKRLVATDEGKKELEKELGQRLEKISELIEVKLVSPHKLQETAEKFYKDQDLKFNRIPGGAYLMADPLPQKEMHEFYEDIAAGKIKKMIALDSVSDVQNGAAIMRTAAFYGIDAVIYAAKGNFGQTPSFYRIASGATELVPLVRAPSLTRVISKLTELGVSCLGLSEHAERPLAQHSDHQNSLCLFLGAEDRGLSHAVKRQLTELYSLPALGELKSLNVSVASAVAMDRVFGKKT